MFDVSAERTVRPELVEGQSRTVTDEATGSCITKFAATCFDRLSKNGFQGIDRKMTRLNCE